METNELVKALRRMKVQTGSLMCLGCGHEHNCGIHGCAVILKAADTIEELDNFTDSQCARLMIENQKLQQELQAEKCRIGSEWLDPEIETPPDSGAVLGLVNGAIDGIEHQNAVSLVCYDRGEWWLFDRPSIDANVCQWMPLPELPEKEEKLTADVAPVRHGRWEVVVGSDGKEHMVCTVCRKQQDLTGVFCYCPNCGADMRGG